VRQSVAIHNIPVADHGGEEALALVKSSASSLIGHSSACGCLFFAQG
jgi:hypothetical protein